MENIKTSKGKTPKCLATNCQWRRNNPTLNTRFDRVIARKKGLFPCECLCMWWEFERKTREEFRNYVG